MADFTNINRTLWAQTAPVSADFHALEGQINADAVIIGAGYTGMSCALHFAEMGHRCIVLEAREPGWGGSGRNAGQWLPGWAGRTPGNVEEQLGVERGRALNKFNLEATLGLPEFISKHGIAADIERSGILVVAHTRKKLAELETMHESWGRLGAKTTLVEKKDLGSYICTQRYFGGLVYGDGGSLNPLAYARGLARAVTTAGARIFVSSPALHADFCDDRWSVTTPNGKVIADRLAICTNAYTDALWPDLARSFYRLRIAVIASEVLPDASKNFMPGGVPFADTNTLSLFGGMQDAEGRFIASVPPRQRDGASIKSLSKSFDAKFCRVFKGHSPPRWRHSWLGDLCVAPDRIPKLFSLGRRAMAAMGYSGAGIALGTAMGRELAHCLLSKGPFDSPVPIVDPTPAPLTRTIPLLYRRLATPVTRCLDYFY